MGVIALCDARPPSGELSPVLSEIFLTLARQAEREVRKVLSQRLAQADWAPPALINILALDEIEIARPVLAASPLLQDDDLLRVLVETTLEHQIEVARRPHLGGRVADAIIDRGEPATVTALAFNRTAEISLDGLRRLVEQSRRVAALRGPLTRHPRMTEQLAEQMYLWVGAALRQSICARFQVDEARLTPLIERSVYDARSGTMQPAPANDEDRDEMERRLVAKLQAAGQLRAGYLVRAIRERRLGLFVHALAALGGVSVGQVREALAARSPEALYYACAAAGVDRAVYPALLNEIRLLNDGLPGDAGAPVWTRGAISAASAGRSFRALIKS
ncbi:MAG: DUF2336 domain-containing protein [Brevundimonas sp.]|nr:DUF2336 domain-containing protein [Brevundimonas sp.]